MARAVAAHVFDIGLRLLHPVMPFITEALWRRLPGRDGEALMVATWPSPAPNLDEAALADFAVLQEAIGALRLRRAQDKVPPSETRPALMQGATARVAGLLGENEALVGRLARIEALRLADGDGTLRGETVLLDGAPVTFALERTAGDAAAEQARIAKELARLRGLVTAQEGKLANEAFVSRAPAAVVDKERQKLAALEAEVATLTRQLGDE